MQINPNMLIDDKKWIEKIGADGVFEEKITQWIKDCKSGSLSKEDILNVTKKVSEHRNTPSLIEEIRQRLN